MADLILVSLKYLGVVYSVVGVLAMKTEHSLMTSCTGHFVQMGQLSCVRMKVQPKSGSAAEIGVVSILPSETKVDTKAPRICGMN